MKWRLLEDGSAWFARGRAQFRAVYLVAVFSPSGDLADATGVRLSRIPELIPLHQPYFEALTAMENTLDFPLGRGPGRPAGAPEVSALVEAAKAWAEQYESGRGSVAWRPVPAPGWVPLRVTVAELRADRFELDDRTAAEEVLRYSGHIEDMPDETRLQLLGYLASAVLRRLPPAAGAADSCPNC